MTLFSKEFKEELGHLSSLEKDKLIWRLLKKDINLAKRLFFELVDIRSTEDRRLLVKEHIITNVKQASKYFSKISYLNMDVRYLSGDISEHVRTTKDKYGDASLNLLLLNETLRLNKNNIVTAKPPIKLHKFCISIIARVFKVLLLINKMDADLLLDFKEDLHTLGNLIAENNPVMDTAMKNGLDVNWLLHAEIPEDLVSMHKELRSNGFLR